MRRTYGESVTLAGELVIAMFGVATTYQKDRAGMKIVNEGHLGNPEKSLTRLPLC